MTNLSQQQIDFRNAMAQLPGAVNITTKHTKQAARREVAEQDKGARFNRNRRHDVCSFIKLSYKHLFEVIIPGKNVVKPQHLSNVQIPSGGRSGPSVG